MQEQPEMAILYHNFKCAIFINGKGFEIIGLSLYSIKSKWDDILNKNGINWIHVSDLRFWNSPVVRLYNIQELPFNLLIDGNGIIPMKNTHGVELGKELAKYLLKE
jgi:hypothetical protein